jgi:hypothetical protein
MGLFGGKVKHPLAGLSPHALRQGTQIALVDVEPDFVAFVRETKPKVPRLGHEVPIALVKRGEQVLAFYDDQQVGTLSPDLLGYYADEFDALERRREYGLTVAYIKPEGAKSPHAAALNWGRGAVDGGIL